jgi:hypothetical protein
MNTNSKALSRQPFAFARLPGCMHPHPQQKDDYQAVGEQFMVRHAFLIVQNQNFLRRTIPGEAGGKRRPGGGRRFAAPPVFGCQ